MSANELLTKRSDFKPPRHAETPFTRAQNEWNDRQGALIKSARNWRLQAWLGYLCAAAAVAGLTYKSLQSNIAPYYIRVSDNGQPTVIGRVPETYTPQMAEVRYNLAEWIKWTRGASLDPVLVKQNFGTALMRMRQAAANKLNAWAQTEPRLQNVGRETVSVQNVNVVPIGGTSSYQARWTEEFRNAEGGLKERQTWTATFDIEFEAPKTEKALAANPIGLYIKDFQWTREL